MKFKSNKQTKTDLIKQMTGKECRERCNHKMCPTSTTCNGYDNSK